MFKTIFLNHFAYVGCCKFEMLYFAQYCIPYFGIPIVQF